jgi:hypothetical protein
VARVVDGPDCAGGNEEHDDEGGHDKYETLKDRVMGWATTRTEKKGGPVAMDVDEVEKQEAENDEWWDGLAAAVYPTTKCYNCQGYGHMARECPRKGKGKGEKGGGKGGEKGKGGFGGKGWYGTVEEYGKGSGKKGPTEKLGWKGMTWKGGGDSKVGKNTGGKGWKGGDKGYGYQGTCFTCGKVGHKATECGGIYEVQEGDEEDAGSKDVGGVWVVAGVDETRQKKGCGHDHGGRDEAGPPGLPSRRTLLAFMPKRTEVENSFKIFQVN